MGRLELWRRSSEILCVSSGIWDKGFIRYPGHFIEFHWKGSVIGFALWADVFLADAAISLPACVVMLSVADE